jgi:HEAT repeat protein
MPATLVTLVAIRSELAENVLDYLRALAARTAELPKYYPAHLRSGTNGLTGFDVIRQMVQVVEDRRELEQWLAEEDERSRRAGHEQERLAYGPRRSRPEDVDREDAMRDSHEEEPTEPVSFPWDEQAGARFHRAVILGDPGFGKTWLLSWEAGRLAREAARDLAERQVAVDDLGFPIMVRLSELNRTDGLIEESLLLIVGQYRPRGFRSFVRRKLQTANCVILLDAWDEVPARDDPEEPHSRQELGRRLNRFATAFPQPRMLMSSRTVGYGSSPIPGAQEVELLAFGASQIESFSRVWFDQAAETGARFLETLQQASQVWGLARIPLMLTLMCRAFEERKLSFPTRRVELYEQCLRGLLRDWKIEEKGRETISDAQVDGLLDVLRPAGLALLTEGHEQFSESQMRKKVLPCLQALKPGHELYGRTAAGLIDDLKRDGILILAGEDEYAPMLFMHRTFHEYLAAGALAETANREGWRAISVLVDRKSWLPEWEQVIVLLAGQLIDPGPLARLLLNKRKDDMFRHRLALAALCLAELAVSARAPLCRLVDQATVRVHDIIWHHLKHGTLNAIPHLASAWCAAGHLNGNVRGLPLLTLLVQQLDAAYYDARVARVALPSLGPAAARQEVVTRLLEGLRDQDHEIRKWAAETLGRLGPTIACEHVLTHLVEHGLRDAVYADVRTAATEALVRLGLAARRHLVRLLTDALRDRDGFVCRSAAEALSRLGPPVATQEVVECLSRLLRDSVGFLSDPKTITWHQLTTTEYRVDDGWLHAAQQCSGAAEGLGRLGPTAACVGVEQGLAKALLVSDSEVSFSAAEALVRLGSKIAHEEIIVRLTRGLLDGHLDVRLRAAGALLRLGHEVTSQAAMQLTRRFQHPEFDESCSSVEGMNEAQKSAHRHIAFIHRDRAIEALVRFGAASGGEVITQLQEWLRPDERDFSFTGREPEVVVAAKALSQLRQAPSKATFARLSGRFAEYQRGSILQRHSRDRSSRGNRRHRGDSGTLSRRATEFGLELVVECRESVRPARACGGNRDCGEPAHRLLAPSQRWETSICCRGVRTVRNCRRNRRSRSADHGTAPGTELVGARHGFGGTGAVGATGSSRRGD